MILEIEGLEYGQSKSKEFSNWARATIDGLNKDLYDAKNEIARLQPFADCADERAVELDEKDRTIRDLEEQISNLKAAAFPKSKAPSYAPGYKRK